MAVSAVVLVSCGDDEGDEPNGPVNIDKLTSNAIITTEDGEQVLCTKVGDYMNIVYNSENFPIRVEDYRIRYDEGVIVDSDGDEYNFSLNSKGFLSKVSFSYRGSDYSGSENITLTYDGSDHLTKIAVNYKEIDQESDYDCTEEGSITMTLTWSGDNIKSVKIIDKGTHTHTGAESLRETYQEEENYTVNNSDKARVRQTTKGFVDMLEVGGVYRGLAYAGMLGKAPANLPTDITCEEYENEDGEYYEDVQDITISYRFNPDGTIRTETTNEAGYTYSTNYSYTSAKTRAGMLDDTPFVVKGKTDRRSKLMFAGKRHHNKK